jgi:FlaG/FlaF family flagellin (archaellin)
MLKKIDHNRAEAPIIGTLLMVGLAIVFLAVAGVYVFGLPVWKESPKQAYFEIETVTTPDGKNYFEVFNAAGDDILIQSGEEAQLKILYPDGNMSTVKKGNCLTDFRTGDTAYLFYHNTSELTGFVLSAQRPVSANISDLGEGTWTFILVDTEKDITICRNSVEI